MEIKFQDEDLVKIQPQGMFADRVTIQESYEYAELIAKSSDSYIHAIAPWFVLYNTIANNYYLIPKSKIDGQI
jgi:hypothetical protein